MRKQRLLIEDIEDDKKKKRNKNILLSTIETLKQVLLIDIMQIIRDRFPTFQKSPIINKNPPLTNNFKVKDLTLPTVKPKKDHKSNPFESIKKNPSVKNKNTAQKINR